MKGKPYNVDIRIIRLNGVERVVNATGEVEFDAEGKPVRMFGIVQDITERKKTELVIFEAREYAQNIMATMREPLLILDDNLTVLSANNSFYRTFEVTPKETEGNCIYTLGNSQWDIPKLRELLEKIIPKQQFFADFEVEHDFPKVGSRTMLLNARQIIQRVKGASLIQRRR